MSFTPQIDGTTFGAMRVQTRPIDPGAGGSYSMSVVTGVMAAGLAAGAEIVQFLWSSATLLAVIEEIRFDGGGNVTTAFTQGIYRFAAKLARAYTVAGTGGGAMTITTNNAKLRTSFPTTAVGEIRVATTATLTAGTAVLDAQAFGAATGSINQTIGSGFPQALIYQPYASGHPIVLAKDEGFVIQATVPATGIWTGGFTVRWSEVAAY